MARFTALEKRLQEKNEWSWTVFNQIDFSNYREIAEETDDKELEGHEWEASDAGANRGDEVTKCPC
jgi:hypothetical protein